MSESVPKHPVLMIDDEADWLNSLALSLKISAGINNVIKCTDSRVIPQILTQDSYSLVLLDLTMPHISGEELLEHISTNHPDLPVIIISGMNQIDTAIRCVKKGAEDFYVKTDDRERVVTGINRVLKHQQLALENRQLNKLIMQQNTVEHPAFSDIITASAAMHKIFSYLQAISLSTEPVLITGESGTGKELIAKSIHHLSNSESPWVAVNVAGLEDTVFSDTLFGHTKGAFTGAEQDRPGMIEQAQGGTLFLDEIGDLAIASQIKLLRLLQEGEYYPLGSDKPRKVKARILVATNHDLQAKEQKGEFRRDLLYRLWAHRVVIPPLRERKEDLAPLLNHFLIQAANTQKKICPTPPSELVPLLATHNFPGNIRELRALVFNAVSMHERGVLSMSSFREALSANRTSQANDETQHEELVIFNNELPTLKHISKLLVDEAMERAKKNQTLAAQILGISPQALSKRLKTNKE